MTSSLCRASNSGLLSRKRSTARSRSSWSHALVRRTPPTSQKSARIACIKNRTATIHNNWIEYDGLRPAGASSFGQRLGSSGTACAGDVNARAEVVMLRHAISADVQLVHAAVNYGRLGAAKIAASANWLGWCLFGPCTSCTLQSACLKIEAGADAQKAERD